MRTSKSRNYDFQSYYIASMGMKSLNIIDDNFLKNHTEFEIVPVEHPRWSSNFKILV